MDEDGEKGIRMGEGERSSGVEREEWMVGKGERTRDGEGRMDEEGRRDEKGRRDEMGRRDGEGKRN